jgi:hypothetical protein
MIMVMMVVMVVVAVMVMVVMMMRGECWTGKHHQEQRGSKNLLHAKKGNTLAALMVGFCLPTSIKTGTGALANVRTGVNW